MVGGGDIVFLRKHCFNLCSTDNDIFCDVTEELASLKTENSDISCDVTEELASLKTENKDIVQDSINLVNLQNLERYLTENYSYDYLWKKDKVQGSEYLWKERCKVLSNLVT